MFILKDIVRDIGFRVKELRELSDISIEKIAKELNINNEDYVLYENGEKDIPVSILYEISQILNVDMGLLVSGEETRMHIFNITRSGKGVPIEQREGYECENLADRFVHKKLETMTVKVEPSNDKPPLNSHPGQEFNYVLEGSLMLYIHNREIILNEGDSIFFDSNYEHAMKALNNKKAKFLAVIVQ
ncbi:cupin domain-containing protein [Methanobrevibacter sp. TMH8]|uniref:helix-turn-helix domain-containing protein n=1 Tax=Methanobrevibacter sp. TMH8 TaxID=2848611 RepID=UPI001CCACCFA|nr:cupin domain-containing protein [Methanobrevibacter sp. TMH8]